MATLQEIYAASQPNGELAGRIEAAFIKASWAVVYEDPGTTDHANRLALAKLMLQGPRPYVERYFRFVISDGTIQAGLSDTPTITDTSIENAVNGFWTTIENVEAA